MPQYVEVILPLPLYSTFTYHIPSSIDGEVKIGSRVLVPFGRKKYYTAIVTLLHDNAPTKYEVKDIQVLLDDYPIIRYPQLKFWNWISEYYLCSLGDVYKAAVPTGLKVESETFVTLNRDYEESELSELKERERIVLDFIGSRDRVQPAEIEKSTGFRNVEALVSRLLDKEAIYVAEKVVNNYAPKTETYISLTIDQGDDDGIHRFFEQVKQAKKQELLLLAFLDLSHWIRKGDVREVSKKELLERAGVTAVVLSAIIAKGIMRIYKKEINRFATTELQTITMPTLTKEQQAVYWKMLDSFDDKAITLLHGVTSSGKTEIYITLINEMLRNNKQVLYLVPEIALTTQLTQRLQRVFGNRLLIYHSKFSDNERVDIWKRLLHSSEPCIVIGVRSSVFLPYSNLGLIIVDEEHDSSYKQQDPAPRYNGRNAAMVLASMHGAKTLLGSATPSIESYYNATEGRYGLVELSTRYEGIEMPEVEIIDIKAARKKKELKGIFSSQLIGDCHKALDAGEQIILFQNRRGYAPMVLCKECGWVPKCENCDVSLTYHKHNDTLNCHYCGFTYMLPKLCPACKQATLEIIGYGTERIEDDIEEAFPNFKIARMDLDTTRSKSSYDRLIDDFSSGKSQILVGTQMVTKGLDFDGVSIVGVLNADTMINFPDFRAHERAFNMLEQVAGRAGRKHKQGRVLIQTSDTTSELFGYLKQHDYKGFYSSELEERKRFKYPPFTKLIYIYLKHKDNNIVTEVSVRYSNMLRQVFENRVLGPEAPIVARVQQFHIRQIVLKMENESSMVKVKLILRKIYENMLKADSRMKGTILYYDVDPM
ncbi:MAG: primosomal protein N' [Muribaculaceae bacterium]